MGRREHLGWEAVAALAALAALGALGGAAEAVRILAVVPIAAPSHHIAISAVTKALADKGHDVTYVSGLEKGNKINPANNKLIHLPNPSQAGLKEQLKKFWEQARNKVGQIAFLYEFGTLTVNNTLNHPLFQAEVNKPGQKYDLIILEAFFFQEAFVGLGHQFGAPVVNINPFGATQWINEVMGNPVNPAWVPSPFLGFPDRMSFVERATNAMMHLVSHLSHKYYHMPMQQEIVSRVWPDAAPLGDLLRTKVDLTLVNNHFTLTYPAPISPNVVEIGGIQLAEKVKPLPKDLQEFLDGAKEGVVYFSMGSNLKMEFIPEEKGKMILGALGALKQKVLLKWDGPAPKNVPANVRIIQWAPQGDLLAHPNIRVFVTHGGLLSTQESVYHGVPVVGLPMFGDQHFNMLIAANKGFGVTADFMTMTKEDLLAAINEVLGSPKYKQSAGRLSRLFRAKPMRPIEAALWSIEHVLEHGGDHLRPASVGMPLYQLLLLDVIAAALAPLVAVLLCCRALCCRGKKAGHADKTAKRKKNN